MGKKASIALGESTKKISAEICMEGKSHEDIEQNPNEKKPLSIGESTNNRPSIKGQNGHNGRIKHQGMAMIRR